nr:immunoglobulin heavy chain junction region [Macaca mulatta]MOV50078.1 immunoglobulin heavy chain junction region [Macaca mulatta]MOV50520.1 immunoglobulin heavy chain junction region [Macaca mulatta]
CATSWPGYSPLAVW